MRQYQDMLRHILANGQHKNDRTGTGTTSVFGYQTRYNLQEGFPLQTTKRVFWRGVVEELLWMIRGETNVRSLQEEGVSIWDEWADENGDLGPVYGKQWRSWRGSARLEWPEPGDDLPDVGADYDESDQDNLLPWVEYNTIDQIARVIDSLKTDPDSRRHIVTAWNPGEIDDMALAPCHCFFQFNTRALTPAHRYGLAFRKRGESSQSFVGVRPEEMTRILDQEGVPSRYLDCQLYQRSADAFLGVPFNIASYALLTHMIAQATNMVPGEFIHTFGDLHIYDNHRDQVDEVLRREPQKLPTLRLAPEITDIDAFRAEHIILEGYEPRGKISAPVAV